MRSGSPLVSHQSHIHTCGRLPRHTQAVDPSQRVVLLDTSGLAPAREVATRDAVVNPGEVELVAQVVRGLRQAGAGPQDLGLVSPYRAQVRAVGQEG